MAKIEYEEKNFSDKTMSLIYAADEIITEYVAQGFQLTLRQLYYQFVARGYIENTERSYKRIGNVVSDARRAGLIDWEAIVDRTRYMRKLTAWDNPEQILRAARDSFHRDLWENQLRRVEVWIEKDALVGVIEGICQEHDVPYFSCRGYVSDSEMWQAGMRHLKNQDNGQETVVLHLGDHDPSGIDMSRDIETRLCLFTKGDTCVNIKRIALTMDQINEVNPPPNPAKITDSRFKGYLEKYGSESWELDALDPAYLRNLIDNEIQQIQDPDLWDKAKDRQESERAIIAEIVKNVNGTK